MNGANVEKNIAISSKGIAWKSENTVKFVNLAGSSKLDQWIDVEDGSILCYKNDSWYG
jgi:hypothetical protein